MPKIHSDLEQQMEKSANKEVDVEGQAQIEDSYKNVQHTPHNIKIQTQNLQKNQKNEIHTQPK